MLEMIENEMIVHSAAWILTRQFSETFIFQGVLVTDFTFRLYGNMKKDSDVVIHLRGQLVKIH